MKHFVPLHCHLIGLVMYHKKICCAAVGGGYAGEGGGQEGGGDGRDGE